MDGPTFESGDSAGWKAPSQHRRTSLRKFQNLSTYTGRCSNRKITQLHLHRRYRCSRSHPTGLSGSGNQRCEPGRSRGVKFPFARIQWDFGRTSRIHPRENRATRPRRPHRDRLRTTNRAAARTTRATFGIFIRDKGSWHRSDMAGARALRVPCAGKRCVPLCHRAGRSSAGRRAALG